MRGNFALAACLVASLAFSQGPAEAISFDTPIRVESLDGGVRWASDGGVCLTPAGYGKVDSELTRLQQVEADKVDSRRDFFLGGVIVGGVTTAILAGLAAAVYLKR